MVDAGYGKYSGARGSGFFPSLTLSIALVIMTLLLNHPSFPKRSCNIPVTFIEEVDYQK
jgi:hypothetical protein